MEAEITYVSPSRWEVSVNGSHVGTANALLAAKILAERHTGVLRWPAVFGGQGRARNRMVGRTLRLVA